MARPRLFTIPPGVPYLGAFVRALFAGEIIPGLSREAGPLALADLTIYVPTRRATRALIAEFAAQSERGATLLPKIRPLGAVDEEAALFSEPDESFASFDPAIPPAVGDLERRFLLAGLVHAWAQKLKKAIVGVGRDGEFLTDANQSLAVGATPADALALAGELAALIDEFIVEGADWSAVRHLAADDYDRYWGISAAFLKIAIELWPAILGERGAIDAAERRARLIRREIDRLAQADEPTIVLGSTGTNRATAELMRAIARLPRGAVVLPGLDDMMPDKDWRLVAGDAEAETAHGHPQAALARLLGRLDAFRDEVVALGSPEGALDKRRRFVSQALAPSAATPDWRGYVARHGGERAEALADVRLIEAADEREEALAIAICLREVLETPGKTAALITPDRAIARRVRAELARWGLDVDDSGGEPLATTRAGAFARAALNAACEGSDVALLALLGHDAVAPVNDRDRTKRVAQAIEIGVLRATPHDPDWRARMAVAREAASDWRAHGAARRISPLEWEDMGPTALAIDAALAPLREAGGKHAVGEWIARHRACLAALGAQAEARDDEDAIVLERLFDEAGAVGAEAPHGLSLDLDDYRAFFDRLVAGATVRGPQRAHARLKILGLLEARLLDADLIVIAGLDEAIWPPQPKSDAFLNRPMRAQLGLTPPERRIGQSAHDFAMAMGAREVVLTRALKRARAPTVASRFLQRIAALAEPAVHDSVRARGARFVALARLIDNAQASPPLKRPAPRPPVALRPARLSVTRIETLRRDPYAIYAERILELQPLAALDFAIGASEQGMGVHEALKALVERWSSGPLPDDARAFLIEAARAELAPFFADPAWRAFRWRVVEEGLDYLLRYEAERRPALARILPEIKGSLTFPLADGSLFELSGVADRIEFDRAGHARIVDYKTGQPPSPKLIRIGIAAQLTLEGAMARRGAFKDLGAVEPESGLYLKLGGKDGGKQVAAPVAGAEFVALAEEHFAQLGELLSSYRDASQGYPSRALAQYISHEGAYDHLARVKEWSASGGGAEDAE